LIEAVHDLAAFVTFVVFVGTGIRSPALSILAECCGLGVVLYWMETNGVNLRKKKKIQMKNVKCKMENVKAMINHYSLVLHVSSARA
jgi:hypothetical protein